MKFAFKLLQQLRLRFLLLVILLLVGIVPLAVSSWLVVKQNREILETQERTHLTRSAQFLSVELNQRLVAVEQQLQLLGQTVLTAPPEADVATKLRQPWLQQQMQTLLYSQYETELAAIRVLEASGKGPYASLVRLAPETVIVLDESYAEAKASGGTTYEFLQLMPSREPSAALTVPIVVEEGQAPVFVQAVMPLTRMEEVFQQETSGQVEVFLVDRSGDLLWWGDVTEETRRAVADSRLVRDFVQAPLNMTQEYALEIRGTERRMLGRISPVEAPGWGILVQRSADLAPAAVRQMVVNTALSTSILVVLAFLIAAMTARRVSRPIQELATRTHEISAGKFDKKLEVLGPSREIRELAEDFNCMSDQIQEHVERLREAARVNRELFIGSMRSFVAAIDAKDPYTRGHSERVAAYSRTIAKHFGLSPEEQNRIWIGALLHDVGKIGVEDRILRKVDRLNEAEFDLMKQHPVIGAQIMSRIGQLREMLPAIRWHHEAWDGSGYPDGLQGEEIPLAARIVGVADTFDAITTNRPYQKAAEEASAVETIQSLAGKRFDEGVVEAFHQAFEAGQIQKREPQGSRVVSAVVAPIDRIAASN